MAEEKQKQNEEPTALMLPTEDFFKTLDHALVVQHLDNRVEAAWIYQFEVGGKTVVNLGKDGAAETAIALAQLSQGRYCIEAIAVQDVTDYGDRIDAAVKVGVFTRGLSPDGKTVLSMPITSVVGYASQPKVIEARDGRRVTVNHPRTQAVHKAERNGMNWLIPEKLRLTIINIARKTGRVAEGEEDTTSTGTGNSKGKGQATDKQMKFISRLLKNEDLPDDVRDKADAAIAKGLTSKQASDWIGTLQGAIEEAKAKQEEAKTSGPSMF